MTNTNDPRDPLALAIGQAIMALIDASKDAPAVDPPPVDVPPTDPPEDPSPVEPPPNSVPARVVSQELTPSKYVVKVGETFTIEGLLVLDNQTSKPVTTYYVGVDKALLLSPNSWSPWFTALAPGVAKITNSNSNTTGRTSVTILANDDGEVFPPPPAPPPRTPAPTPTDPPAGTPKPPKVPGKPAPSVHPETPPNSPVGSGPNKTVVHVMDGAARLWQAIGNVGDDPSAPGMLACLVDENGNSHPRLQAKFHADGCNVFVSRMDNAYDEVGCQLEVTYNGGAVEVPPSSYEDGTYTFWKGCRMPTIRYGKQVEMDPSRIRWDLLPAYTTDIQKPISIAKYDFTFNGMGATTMGGMGSAGERGDIGYMQWLYMSFILNPTAETWAAVVKAEDWSGNWNSVCVSEPATGGIIKYTDYKMATILPPAQSSAWQSDNPVALYGGSYRGDVLTPPKSFWETSGSPYIANTAHLTSYGMLAPMITHASIDENLASFWANYCLIDQGPGYTKATGNVWGAQRRFAWGSRSLFIAAYISSDTEYFMAEIKRQYAIADKVPKNEFGIFLTDHPYAGKGEAYKYTGIAPWMQSYLAQHYDAAARKMPEAVDLAQDLGKFEVTFHSKTYWMCRTVYNLICIDPAGKLMTDFDEIVKLSLCNNGWALEDAEAMVGAKTTEDAYAAAVANAARSGRKPSGKIVNGYTDFIGNPLSSDSYPAGAIMAGYAAVNCRTPGAEIVLEHIENLPTLPDYTTNEKNQKYHLKQAPRR